MAHGAFIEVVEEVIGKTGNLADQIGLSSCIKDELEKLRNTVSTIKPVVLNAEEKQARNRALSVWLRNLKDAVNEADNLLDEFSSEVSRRDLMTQKKEAKKVCISFPKLNQLAYDLKMGHNNKAIRKRLDAIEGDRYMLGLRIRIGETQVEDRERQTHSIVFSEEVIGRENDKKAIIGILLDPNVKGNVAVLRIVGPGGLGKTTLAKLVFNDEEIGNHFEIRLWVCLSDDFDIKRIVQKILESAKGEREEALEMNTLINDLHQEIGGRRYLLVFDDLWNMGDKWYNLWHLWRTGAKGSRILVTTRNLAVGKITQTIKPYFLRELSPHDSWLLFERFTFKEGEEPDLRIKAIGIEIVEMCRGLPLAIRTMGRILYSKRDVRDWLSLKNNELSKVMQEGNDIVSIMKLSYKYLPSHLKQCCAYCSLFPKDYNINKQTLIRLWMAQGFIKLSDPNECLEDVGHEYFRELLSRSFFQEVEEDERGNTSFKIRYLIHDLLTLVAGQESVIINIDGEHIVDGINTVPSSISKLNHVRYLDLSDNRMIKMLPQSLSRLPNLQTLKLSGCVQLKELPRDISKLVNLRFLEIDGCRDLIYMPYGLGQLTILRTLSQFVISKDTSSVSTNNGELEKCNHQLTNLFKF